MLELGTEQPTASQQPRRAHPGPRRERRRFWTGLGLIVAGDLVGRILYVMIVTRHQNAKLYDSLWYEL